MDLSGKVAIVTGSGRGRGLGYARALAGAGAAVVVNDVDADAASQAAAAITEAGGRASAHAAAVGTAGAAQALVDAGITGQAIGIGGDRLALWSHPAEAAVRFADGTGWSADDIARAWPAAFAGHQQPVGQQFPEPPQ